MTYCLLGTRRLMDPAKRRNKPLEKHHRARDGNQRPAQETSTMSRRQWMMFN